MNDMVSNEWKWVSVVGPTLPGEDYNGKLYIFDTVDQFTQVRLADMEVEVFS
jgi:hypothetical protein